MGEIETENASQIIAVSPFQENLFARILSDRPPASATARILAQIEGPLTEEGCRKALASVQAHHSALRTGFDWQDPEKLKQRIFPDQPINLRWMARRDDPDLHPEIDLGNRPLLSMGVLQVAPNKFDVELAIHSLIVDQASVSIILQDFLLQLNGKPLSAAPDFAEHMAWIELLDHAADADFWYGYLAGYSSEPLPPKGDGSGIGVLETQLDLDLMDRLQINANTIGVSLENVLQLAFGEAVGQLKDRRDVLIGLISHGRNSPIANISNCVGSLENLVPLRIELDNPDILQDLAETTKSLEARSHVPQSMLIEWAELEPHCDLIEVSLALRETPALASSGPFSVEQLSSIVPNGAPIEVDVNLDTGAIYALFDRSLFNAPQVQAFLAAFELAARGAGEATSAAHCIEGPQLESDATDVIERFLAIAESMPKATAVTDANDRLTFSGLRDSAASIAAYLIQKEIGPGDHVALVLPRQVESIVGMLGVMMSGASFTFLDQSMSDKRQVQILSALDPKLVLSDGRSGMVDINGIEDAPALEQIKVNVETPAYVCFPVDLMSPPKGIIVSRSALAHSQAARDSFYPNAPDCFLMASPIGSDSALAGIFACLTNGGNLVLADEASLSNAARLAAHVAQHKITDMLLQPNLYQALLTSHGVALGSLRQVIVTGETCPRGLPHLHALTLPDCWLANEYGPPEATIWATAEINGPREAAPMSLGKPITGMRVYLIDQNGVPSTNGQIVLSGPTLASEYLNDPEETAHAFRELSLSDGHIERSFWTGDYGELTPDGRIIFLGRRDGYIKFKGNRLHLPALEAEIAEIDGIDDVALDPIASADDPTIHLRLVAYIASALAKDELETKLANQLPVEVKPDQIVVLETVPRLPNGKLDQRKLPLLATPQMPEILADASSDDMPILEPSQALPVSKNVFLLGVKNEALAGLAKQLKPGIMLHDLPLFWQDDTKPLNSIEEAAMRMVPHIREKQAYGPYVIGGTDMGAVLAHEVARQLVALGEDVSRLILIDPPENPEVFAKAYNRDHVFTGSRSDRVAYRTSGGFGLRSLSNLFLKTATLEGRDSLIHLAKYYTLREPAAPPFIIRRTSRTPTTQWAKTEDPYELHEIQCSRSAFSEDEAVVQEWTKLLAGILN